MDEGFKKEQQARQQIQQEMMQGFKNEEYARQLDQKELAFMKDEIKNLQMDGGNTVCSEASTGMRLPLLTSRWNEILIPRKVEFKGWVTDCSEGNLQGITDDDVAKLLGYLERMMPHNAQEWIDWDQTKKEQRNLAEEDYGKYVVQA